jgi:hypothetical protein
MFDRPAGHRYDWSGRKGTTLLEKRFEQLSIMGVGLIGGAVCMAAS